MRLTTRQPSTRCTSILSIPLTFGLTEARHHALRSLFAALDDKANVPLLVDLDLTLLDADGDQSL